MMILSGDPPRSRLLSLVLLVIILALAATPFLFPGAKPLNVAAKICVFAALVASYDLLLGYTGTVSFAHTMFYGIGSYGIAIALYVFMADCLHASHSGVDAIRTVLPTRFSSLTFCAALGLMAAPVLHLGWQIWSPGWKKKAAIAVEEEFSCKSSPQN